MVYLDAYKRVDIKTSNKVPTQSDRKRKVKTHERKPPKSVLEG